MLITKRYLRVLATILAVLLLAFPGCRRSNTALPTPQAPQQSSDATQELFKSVSLLTRAQINAMDYDEAGAALNNVELARREARKINDSDMLTLIEEKQRLLRNRLVDIRKQE